MQTRMEQIFEVFLSALDLPDDFELTPESAYEEVPGWDSLGHMRIIAELEEVFDIEFELEEIVDQNTLAKIHDMVEGKLG